MTVEPPGFYIREELEERGWSQRDLAYILGCPEQAVNMIISGKRGISPEMAKALGHAFDVPPEFFANLQNHYDLSRARDPDPGVGKRARLQDQYPVREMIKRGWLQNTDATLLEVQMMQFFDCDSPDEVPHMAHAAMKPAVDESVPAPQLAWLYRVRQIAKASSPLKRYSESALRDALAQLRRLMVAPEEARQVARILADCGVRYILVEGLPAGRIDGVCFWLGDGPVIGMSLRFDRIDNFWFVLRHEIEHVLREDARERAIIDLDLDEGGDDLPPEEIAANEAAREFCVPVREMDAFIARKQPFFSERDILGFARRMQVHPGVAVGQLQRRTGRYELLRKHLAKIRLFATSGAIVDGWGSIAPID